MILVTQQHYFGCSSQKKQSHTIVVSVYCKCHQQLSDDLSVMMISPSGVKADQNMSGRRLSNDYCGTESADNDELFVYALANASKCRDFNF